MPAWSDRLGPVLLSFGLICSSACAHSKAGGKSSAASMLEIEVVDGHRDADVWVDGQYVGQVEAVSGKLRLAPGKHRVEVRKPGHFPVQRTVEVERKPAEVVRVKAEMLGDPR